MRSRLLKRPGGDREMVDILVYRDLTGFDFGQSTVDEALVKSLHRCQFLEDAQNVVLVGGPVLAPQ